MLPESQAEDVADWLDLRTKPGEFADWFADPNSHVAWINRFLRADKAADLDEVLRCESLVWHRSLWIFNDRGDLDSVPEEAWGGTPGERRFSSFDIGDLPSGPESPALPARFRNLVGGDQFIAWLSALVGRRLSRLVSFRLTRYHAGDFIAEHKDAADGRILRLNLYLDSRWQPGWGGELGFRNERNAASLLEPRFNLLAMSPVRPGCDHWVEPWTAVVEGRGSIAMSYS